MNREWIRSYCLSLPHTTEHALWKIDLVFKVGGKMYATLVLEPHPVCLAFKCSPEDFDELIERGYKQAARFTWTASGLQVRKLLERLAAR